MPAVEGHLRGSDSNLCDTSTVQGAVSFSFQNNPMMAPLVLVCLTRHVGRAVPILSCPVDSPMQTLVQKSGEGRVIIDAKADKFGMPAGHIVAQAQPATQQETKAKAKADKAAASAKAKEEKAKAAAAAKEAKAKAKADKAAASAKAKEEKAKAAAAAKEAKAKAKAEKKK